MQTQAKRADAPAAAEERLRQALQGLAKARHAAASQASETGTGRGTEAGQSAPSGQ